MDSKKCSKCGEVKLIKEFWSDVSHKDGHRSACKSCALKAHHEWRHEKREHVEPPAEKVCVYCGRVRPSSMFTSHSKTPDGLQPYERECNRRYSIVSAPYCKEIALLKKRRDDLDKQIADVDRQIADVDNARRDAVEADRVVARGEQIQAEQIPTLVQPSLPMIDNTPTVAPELLTVMQAMARDQAITRDLLNKIVTDLYGTGGTPKG